MRRMRLLAFLGFLIWSMLCVCGPTRAQDDHDHDHENDADHAGFGMKILFRASSDNIKLIWTKQKDVEHPLLYFIEVGNGINCGENELKEAREQVEELVEEIEHGHVSPIEFSPSEVILATVGAAELHASENIPMAMYGLQLFSSNCTAIFAQQSREDNGLFFLNETSGLVAEFAYEEESDSPIDVAGGVGAVVGPALGGAIICGVIPLLVVILCAPFGMMKNPEHLHLFFHFMQAFGCGALLAVVALHIYPEMVIGLHEADAPAWYGGALVLGGIAAVALIHMIVDVVSGKEHDPELGFGAPKTPKLGRQTHQQSTTNQLVDPAASEHGHSHDHQKEVTVEEGHHKEDAGQHNNNNGHHNHHHENGNGGLGKNGHHHDTSADSNSVDSLHIRMGTCRDVCNFRSVHPLIWGITIGDALHNFVDGTIIATAFIACGPAAGWTTVGATIAHEVPQELGDISLMLSKGSTIGQALFFNLVSQIFAVLGCGIVLAIGNELPEAQTSMLLAFGIGTFLFIALTDIMPLLLEVRERLEYLAVIVGFILALAAIGLAGLGEGQCGHSH